MFTETPAIMCPHTGLVLAICHIQVQGDNDMHKGTYTLMNILINSPLIKIQPCNMPLNDKANHASTQRRYDTEAHINLSVQA